MNRSMSRSSRDERNEDQMSPQEYVEAMLSTVGEEVYDR